MNSCRFGWSSLRITALTAGFVNGSVKMPHSFSIKSIDVTYICGSFAQKQLRGVYVLHPPDFPVGI